MKWLGLLILVPALLIVGTLVLNRPPLFGPPGPVARLKAYLTTNVAETSPGNVRPELRTRTYPLGEEALQAAVLTAMKKVGWRDVRVGPAGIQAVAVTPLLGFRDDVTVRLSPIGRGQTRLDARSASRIGRGDLAANERHLLDLFDALPAPAHTGGG
jgi:hypothetical protein